MFSLQPYNSRETVICQSTHENIIKMCRQCVRFLSATNLKITNLWKICIFLFSSQNNSLSFYQILRNIWSKLKKKTIRRFLPCHSNQVQPSQSVFQIKCTKIRFVWSTTKSCFLKYFLYDFNGNIFKIYSFLFRIRWSLKANRPCRKYEKECVQNTNKHEKSYIFV